MGIGIGSGCCVDCYIACTHCYVVTADAIVGRVVRVVAADARIFVIDYGDGERARVSVARCIVDEPYYCRYSKREGYTAERVETSTDGGICCSFAQYIFLAYHAYVVRCVDVPTSTAVGVGVFPSRIGVDRYIACSHCYVVTADAFIRWVIRVVAANAWVFVVCNGNKEVTYSDVVRIVNCCPYYTSRSYVKVLTIQSSIRFYKYRRNSTVNIFQFVRKRHYCNIISCRNIPRIVVMMIITEMFTCMFRKSTLRIVCYFIAIYGRCLVVGNRHMEYTGGIVSKPINYSPSNSCKTNVEYLSLKVINWVVYNRRTSRYSVINYQTISSCVIIYSNIPVCRPVRCICRVVRISWLSFIIMVYVVFKTFRTISSLAFKCRTTYAIVRIHRVRIGRIATNARWLVIGNSYRKRTLVTISCIIIYCPCYRSGSKSEYLSIEGSIWCCQCSICISSYIVGNACHMNIIGSSYIPISTMMCISALISISTI